MQVLGILNVTRDSFSDGGRFLAPGDALAHALQLVADGADIIDVGAESTHPDAEDVSADEEIRRLTPIVRALTANGIHVSVDTHKQAVTCAMLRLGVDIINDVTALRDPEAVAAVRETPARVILMHSVADSARAQRTDADPTTIVQRIVTFFEARLAELQSAGIARERLILDPGMGFFLGRDPAVSLAVLQNLEYLTKLGRPLCVSTSRKSFIGALLGTLESPRPVDQRGAGTLMTELWAVEHGVEYVRTHDVKALRDALRLRQALTGVPAQCTRPGRPHAG